MIYSFVVCFNGQHPITHILYCHIDNPIYILFILDYSQKIQIAKAILFLRSLKPGKSRSFQIRINNQKFFFTCICMFRCPCSRKC